MDEGGSKVIVETIQQPEDDFCDVSYNDETDSVILTLDKDSEGEKISYDSDDYVLCMANDVLLYTSDAKIAVNILTKTIGNTAADFKVFDVKELLDKRKKVCNLRRDGAFSTAGDFISDGELNAIMKSEEIQANQSIQNEDEGNIKKLKQCVGYITSAQEAVNEKIIEEYRTISKKCLENVENKFRELLIEK